MDKGKELCQVVYNILVTQIEFGTYRYADHLPTIEEASRILQVSWDTVRAAYLRLKHHGYIDLTKKMGATVKVAYQEQEIRQHIQDFFLIRRNALIDLSKSIRPLFSHAQWLGFKNAPGELLDAIEQLARRRDVLPSYSMIQHLQQIYGALHNELLMRFVWHSFMFFQAPFLSISANLKYLSAESSPLPTMIECCRQQDWAALRKNVENFQELLSRSLCRFYDDTITKEVPEDQQIDFSWSSYKKTSQICYSFGMELLTGISRGDFPAGSFLPSLERLAKEKQISVSTVRRTLLLLGNIGATRSVNGIGTQVLSLDESADHCDFTQPIVRKRLMDFAESLHFLALSCRECAEITIPFLDVSSKEHWIERLMYIKRAQRYELVVYISLECISCLAPHQVIRTVYSELLQQLFWGYPTRSLHGDQVTLNVFYQPYYDSLLDSIERGDALGYAEKLEELLMYEIRFAVEQLVDLGIREAADLVLP
ncbi:GntR family transcriptional regulator [Diplocloster hominis]|uniref:GntR family transcriptional regulator n=1 Tax=Diplocloster hominis TaxID=3079010 RepID=UPI0031BB810F